jgi:catalase
VLFDAVAVIAAPDGARALADSPAARDFVSDAYAHCKFIGYTSGAAPLLQAAGLQVNDDSAPDDGFISLERHQAQDFITRCRQLRFWDRQHATVA